MDAPVAPVTTPTAVLDRLVEKGHADLIAIARREYALYADAAGINQHRRHIDPDMITYRRGRWHAYVRVLAFLAGMEVSTDESDILEFAHVLSTYSPKEKE